MVPPGGTEMTTLIVFEICDQAAWSKPAMLRASSAAAPINNAWKRGMSTLTE
jgi:hypothetical protein